MSAEDGREVELKLTLNANEAARIARLSRLRNARLGRAKAEHIYSVYYDTPDRALHREGLSLRLRHSGAGRLQTVKTESRQNGLAADRAEDEVRLNGSGPDVQHIANPELRARVAAIAQDAELCPMFETKILRLTRMVRTEGGDVIELALDQGEVQAQDRSETITELELELKSGDPAALYHVARELGGDDGFHVQKLSKSDRGYALLGEQIISPRKATSLKLGKKATVGEALSASLRAVVGHLTANEPSVSEMRDPEGVHQMRVALRRARSVFATFAPTEAGVVLEDLDGRARDLGRVLGHARDLDVFLSDVFKRAADGLPESADALEPLRIAAQHAQGDAWTAVLTTLEAPPYTTFVLDLATAAEESDWPKARRRVRRKASAMDGRAKGFAGERLDKAYARVETLAVRFSELSDKKRHALRKHMKQLRYTGEIFEGLFPRKRTKRYQKCLARLQDTFGALNDVAVASDLTEDLASLYPEAADSIRRAGALVVTWHTPHAETLFDEAQDRWNDIARSDKFWRKS